MHKPLDLPFRLRLWHFIRGLLFYNTVYWKRASDELTPPRLSRKERQLYQPARDLTIIRPREKPRASLDSTQNVPVAVSEAALPPVPAQPVAPEEVLGAALSLPFPVEPEPSQSPVVVPPPDVMVKRRRYRRRRNKVSSLPSSAMGHEKTGLLGRLFGP